MKKGKITLMRKKSVMTQQLPRLIVTFFINYTVITAGVWVVCLPGCEHIFPKAVCSLVIKMCFLLFLPSPAYGVRENTLPQIKS